MSGNNPSSSVNCFDQCGRQWQSIDYISRRTHQCDLIVRAIVVLMQGGKAEFIHLQSDLAPDIIGYAAAESECIWSCYRMVEQVPSDRERGNQSRVSASGPRRHSTYCSPSYLLRNFIVLFHVDFVDDIREITIIRQITVWYPLRMLPNLHKVVFPLTDYPRRNILDAVFGSSHMIKKRIIRQISRCIQEGTIETFQFLQVEFHQDGFELLLVFLRALNNIPEPGGDFIRVSIVIHGISPFHRTCLANQERLAACKRKALKHCRSPVCLYSSQLEWKWKDQFA